MKFFKKYRFQLLIILIGIPYLVLQARNGGDFRILLKGAEHLRNGESPYGILMPIHGMVWDVFLYSPFVAFVMIPFTYIPEFIPTFGFCLINLFVLFRVWRIMSIWLEVDKLSNAQQRWWYILSIVLILRFLLHNFENTQMNILVFYFCLEALYQIFLRGKNSGSLLIALGICLKLLPIIFLPYLIYRKKLKALLLIIPCCALLLFLPALYFGFAFEMQLLHGWWNAINPTLDKYNGGQNVGIIFHCISSLIPVYFSDCSYRGFSVNVMQLDNHQLFWFINIVRVILVLFTFYFLWGGYAAKNHRVLTKLASARLGVRETPNGRDIYFFWELSYIFMLIPLIFPNQNKYAYTNLLPAFAYISYYLVNTFKISSPVGKRDRAIMILMLLPVIIFSILTADIFWGMETGKYFQFLKLITVGALFLIPVLAVFSPGRLFRVVQSLNK